MQKRLSSLALLAACAIASVTPTTAFAWGAQGHRIIAQAAQQQLSAKATIAIHRALDGQNLEDVSNWLDEVRGDPALAKTKKWHYLNIDPCHPTNYDCPEDQCAPAQISRANAVLQNKRSSKAQQAFAIKTLTHLVADIHQPLHAIDHNHDAGGNGVQIDNRQCAAKGKSCTLHQYWDTSLVKSLLRGQSENELATQISAERATVSTSDSNDPMQWAQESTLIATTVAYPPQAQSCRTKADTISVTPQYDGAAKSAIQDQFSRASIRLARMLNAAYE